MTRQYVMGGNAGLTVGGPASQAHDLPGFFLSLVCSFFPFIPLLSLGLEGVGSGQPLSTLCHFSLSCHRVWKAIWKRYILPEASGHDMRSEGNLDDYFYPPLKSNLGEK